jgi:hypothetical protein
MAAKPITTLTTIVTSCIPTLKARMVLRAAAPERAKRSTACCVPSPPGVNGSIVERPCTTRTAAVVSNVASTWKARRKK